LRDLLRHRRVLLLAVHAVHPGAAGHLDRRGAGTDSPPRACRQLHRTRDGQRSREEIGGWEGRWGDKGAIPPSPFPSPYLLRKGGEGTWQTALRRSRIQHLPGRSVSSTASLRSSRKRTRWSRRRAGPMRRATGGSMPTPRFRSTASPKPWVTATTGCRSSCWLGESSAAASA